MAAPQLIAVASSDTDERQYEALCALVQSPGWQLFAHALKTQYSDRAFRQRVSHFVANVPRDAQRETSAQIAAEYAAVLGALEWPYRQIKEYEHRPPPAAPHRRAQ